MSYQAAFNHVRPKVKAQGRFVRAAMDDGTVIPSLVFRNVDFVRLRNAWDQDVAEHGEDAVVSTVSTQWDGLMLRTRICWLVFDDGVRVPLPLGGQKHELPPDQEKERDMMLMVLSCISGREVLGVKLPEIPPLPSL